MRQVPVSSGVTEAAKSGAEHSRRPSSRWPQHSTPPSEPYRSLSPAEGWLTLLGLSGVLLTPVVAVVAAAWVDGLQLLYLVVVAGLLVGLLFAKRVPLGWGWGVLAHLLALGLGTVLIVDVVAGTLPFVDRLDRWERLGIRLLDWLHVVVHGGTATDNLLFLLLLAGVTWLVAYLGAWSVFRWGSAFLPLVATGTALLLNVARAPDLRGYVLLYAFAGLVLVVRLNVYAHEQRWRFMGLPYSPVVSGRTLRLGVLAAGLLSVLAWFAPQAAVAERFQDVVQEALRPWEQAQQEFGRAFGGVQGRDPIAIGGFNTSLTLKGSFTLPETPVLRAWMSEARYLRAIAYERYTGKGWEADQETALVHWAPGDSDVPLRGDDARREFAQRVQLLAPRGNYVLAANEPIGVSIPAVAERPKGRGGVDVADLVALRSNEIRPNRVYEATSRVTVATEAQLRQVGRSYPRQVTDRYQRLPRVPERVTQLARRVAAGQTNPYDQAKAIETYLRSNYTYSLQLTPPPPDRDGVDYFLFDARTGYCDYFASSMVVMLRSLGIPSRVVAGYAVGEQEGAGGPFIVRDSSAHSWVEAYFPGYGWIEFEPSPNRQTFPRPAGAPPKPQTAFATPTPAAPLLAPNAGQSKPSPTPTPKPSEATPTPTGNAPAVDQSAPPSAILRNLAEQLKLPVLALIALALLYSLARALWGRGLAGLLPIERLYAELCRFATLLGRGPRPWQTPDEYAHDLASLDAGIARPIRQIGMAFSALRYGGRHLSVDEETSLEAGWRALRWRFLRVLAWARLWARFQLMLEKIR